jgi:hypothetical protein
MIDPYSEPHYRDDLAHREQPAEHRGFGEADRQAENVKSGWLPSAVRVEPNFPLRRSVTGRAYKMLE